MIAHVAAGSSAERGVEAAVAVVDRDVSAPEVVVERLTANEVGLLYLRSVSQRVGRKSVFHELAVRFVFLVVALAACVVQGGIQFPTLAELVLS